MSEFKYSLNSSTIRTTPLLRKITVAGEVGYTGIELWHDDIDAYLTTGGTISDIRKALADYGLAVPTTIYLGDWFDTIGEAHQKAIDECKRRLQQAADIGASHAIAGPPGGRADYDLGAKHYRELLEIGAQFGVKPAIEFLGFVEQLNTIEDALEIVTRSGHPDATTVLDPFHIQRGGGSVESVAKLSSGQIAVAHFMDTVDHPPREQQHDPHRVMPGDGVFDLKRYLELLRQVGFNGFLSLELFREDLWAQDPREVAQFGLQKMRDVVEKHG
jgi:sugar phosphate isomerase/epimerase